MMVSRPASTKSSGAWANRFDPERAAEAGGEEQPKGKVGLSRHAIRRFRMAEVLEAQGVTVTEWAGDQSGPICVPFFRIRERKKYVPAPRQDGSEDENVA